MAFDNLVAVRNFRHNRGIFFDLLLFEKLRGNRGAHEYLHLVVSLECRRHLLVCYYLNDLIRGSFWILLKEFTGPFNGKVHSTFIINTSLRCNFIVIVRILVKHIVLFLSKHSFFEISFLFVASTVTGRSRRFLFVLLALLFFLTFLLFLLFLTFLLPFVAVAIVFSLLSIVLLLLALLFLLLLVLRQNVIGEFVVHIDHLFRATCSTPVPDAPTLDAVRSFRQTTCGANHKSFDISMHQLLKRIICMSTIDDGAIGILVVGCLRTKFAPKELVYLSGSTMQT
mmetsp:Transcript_16364/g.37884  ORF Transcript_16364/g.37884 Transcript_16364/m.37884 type:complete len:283 (+) Transcript_16364:438-1286(+)